MDSKRLAAAGMEASCGSSAAGFCGTAFADGLWGRRGSGDCTSVSFERTFVAAGDRLCVCPGDL